MRTVRIIYDVDGWAYHHRAQALQRYAPPDFDVSIARLSRGDDLGAALGEVESDLAFVVSQPEVSRVARFLRARRWRTKLVTSWNSGWPLQIPAFYTSYRKAHGVIVNNATAWERVGRLPRTYLLPNGVDLDVFRVRVPIARRKPKVIWVGSEFGRRRKGYDTLVLPLAARLEKAGIECELLLVDSYGPDKRGREEMAEWYNSGTVLVCASSAEGTPNPALEAAACGCTVVSTPVGNMPELIRSGVNGYLVEREPDALFAAVREACVEYPRLAAEMQQDIRHWGWEERSAAFYETFRRVLSPGGRRPRRPDLSDRVTVFLTSVGAPSYDACRAHLRLQDCRYRLEIIRRVAPMSAAFQRMLDRCDTPFFVQVDEDMLLYPHAIRTLHEQIAAAPESVAITIGELYDAHLGRCISGVKIYRHGIVRRYPFENVQSFEKVQVQRMKADGYRVAGDPPARVPCGERTLGLHGTHWTPASIYERYQTLESRRWRHPKDLQWFEEYQRVFLERFIEDPSELNFFALTGTLSGALLGAIGEAGDKDYRTYRALPGFREARRIFDQLRPPKRGAAQSAAGKGDERRPSPASLAATFTSVRPPDGAG